MSEAGAWRGLDGEEGVIVTQTTGPSIPGVKTYVLQCHSDSGTMLRIEAENIEGTLKGVALHLVRLEDEVQRLRALVEGEK